MHTVLYIQLTNDSQNLFFLRVLILAFKYGFGQETAKGLLVFQSSCYLSATQGRDFTLSLFITEHQAERL